VEVNLAAVEGQVGLGALRTDNNIKNHFYSTLRRSLRRLNKLSGEKNATHQMREIKPSVLTIILKFIYDNQEQNENNNGELI
jgi:myb proto-oncogene protein